MCVANRRTLPEGALIYLNIVRTYGKGLPQTDDRFLEIASVLQWNTGQPKGGCCVLLVLFHRERIIHV